MQIRYKLKPLRPNEVFRRKTNKKGNYKLVILQIIGMNQIHLQNKNYSAYSAKINFGVLAKPTKSNQTNMQELI